MRIGLVCESCDRRTGIGRIVNSLGSVFLDNGHEVICASQRFEDVDRKISRYSIPHLTSSNGLNKLLFRFGMPAIRGLKADIVHTFGVGRGADVVSAQSCHHAGHSLLRCYRNQVLERGGFGFYDWVSLGDERALLNAPSTRAIIAVSQLVRSQIEEVYRIDPRKISVIPNGVDYSVFNELRTRDDRLDLQRTLGFPPDSFNLLFVGNEFGRKGLTAVLRAISLLRDKELRLVVVGAGQRRTYEVLAAELRVSESVTFTGSVPNPERFYVAADTLILPSLYEPFGMVVIEAMAAGLPVITSKACGATEGMVHGNHIYQVDDPASAEEVAEAIATLKANTLLRQNIAAGGLEKAKEFAWESVAQRILTVYKEILEKKSTEH